MNTYELSFSADGTRIAFTSNSDLVPGSPGNADGNWEIFLAVSEGYRPALTIQKTGAGSGAVASSPAGIDCGSDCAETYEQGTMVTLTATADTGAEFSGWSGGGCAGTGQCSVIMNDDVSITAAFVKTMNESHIFTLTREGTGSGTVISSPAGIDCGSDCAETYDHGTEVTLTAAADTGAEFSGWSGGGCAGTGQCSVIMNADKTVTATFNLLSGPDLTGNWASFVQTIKETKNGTKCKIKGVFAIQNTGNEDALSSEVRFYLSDDDIYDGGDTFLKEVSTGKKMKVGKIKNKKLKYKLPLGETATGKYVIAVLDADNSIDEVTESNNVTVYGPVQ
jgi:hypothetical protein